MRTLSKYSAEAKVLEYILTVEKAKRAVRNNFEDMDLENNNKRDEIECIIEEMERKCNAVVGTLEGLSFE